MSIYIIEYEVHPYRAIWYYQCEAETEEEAIKMIFIDKGSDVHIREITLEEDQPNDKN